MGAFIPPHFSPHLFKKSCRRGRCFPAMGAVMTAPRQGEVVLPLGEHDRNAVLHRAPLSLVGVVGWVKDAGWEMGPLDYRKSVNPGDLGYF